MRGNVTWKALATGVLLVCAWSGPVARADEARESDQAADDAVTWPLPWRVGVRLEYDQTYRSVSVRNGKPVEITGTDLVSVEIVRADTGGFVQRWTSLAPSLQTDALPADLASTMQAALAAMADIELDVALDEEGSYQGLANLDDVHARYSAALRAMFATLADKQGTTDAATKATFDNMVGMLTARPVMENQLAEQPAAYNFVAGGGLELDAQYEYDDEGTSPIGGKPIKMKNRLWLGEADDPGLYALRWEVEPDAEATAQMIAEAVRKMLAPQLASAGPEAARQIQTAIDGVRRDAKFTTTVEYLVDRQTGIVERMQHVQVKRFGQKDETTTTTHQRRR